jgi:hypothetical protein
MNIGDISAQATKVSSAPSKPATPTESSNKELSLEPVQAVAISKVQLKAPEKVDLGYNAEDLRQSIKQAVENLNQQL